MYPQFCTFPSHLSYPDPYLEAVAADFGLGSRRPGVIVDEVGDTLKVLTTADGQTTCIPSGEVRRGLSETVAIAMMDGVEEAIEDTLDAEPLDTTRLARLEESLRMMERCLESSGEGSVDQT